MGLPEGSELLNLKEILSRPPFISGQEEVKLFVLHLSGMPTLKSFIQTPTETLTRPIQTKSH